MLVAVGMGFSTAWLEGVHNGTGFGWVWLLPGGAALLACAALSVAFFRVPSRLVS